MAASSFLVVRVVECSGLIRENDDASACNLSELRFYLFLFFWGKIDPFVEMTFVTEGKKENKKTHVKTHTADPLFNESFYL